MWLGMSSTSSSIDGLTDFILAKDFISYRTPCRNIYTRSDDRVFDHCVGTDFASFEDDRAGHTGTGSHFGACSYNRPGADSCGWIDLGAGGDEDPVAVLFNLGVDAAFEDVLRVNAIAPLKIAEAFLPSVLASHDKRIVAISSSEGSIGMVNSSRLYFMRASKAALNMEMRNLAFQLKGKGVSVRILNPGLVDTDFMKGLPKNMLRPAPTVVGELIPLIDAMTVENTGSFVSYDGSTLPW